MARRVCAEPNCPTLIPAGTRDGRCDQHRRAKDRARGTRQERGYDAAHERLRAHYQRRMDAGERFVCWRCRDERDVIHHVDPTCWDLGHDDRTGKHRGPECVAGNRATAARRR